MGDTSISWTDKTWNPVRGCSRVSEGCRHCYAELVAARFSGPGQAYEGLADRERKGSKWTGVVRLVPEHLADPLRWRAPVRVFVNSMSDLFHDSLTNEQIAAVFGVMASARRHTFQVLTKRATRMRDWFAWAGRLNLDDLEAEAKLMAGEDRDYIERGYTWPLPNVWLGVSVENQAAANERIPDLLATPAAVRFLSCEPLLGRVDLCNGSRDGSGDWLRAYHRGEINGHGQEILVDRPALSWIIAGCESGHGARECKVEWLRSLRDQCAAASVPFFLKQAVRETDHGDPVIVVGPGARAKARDVIELPYLDGVQHAAFPEVRQ